MKIENFVNGIQIRKWKLRNDIGKCLITICVTTRKKKTPEKLYTQV